MTPIDHLAQRGQATAAQIAGATGLHIESVYAELVKAEAAGLVRVNTDKHHRCTWESMGVARPRISTETT